MIAIFKSEKAALEFSDKIHKFLLEKRKGYSAEIWGVSQADEVNNLWGVKLPTDYKELRLDISNLKIEENTCISQKYYDNEIEITDISKTDTSVLTYKTVLTATVIEPIKIEPIIIKR